MIKKEYEKFCERMDLNPKDLDEVLFALSELQAYSNNSLYYELEEYIYNELMK